MKKILTNSFFCRLKADRLRKDSFIAADTRLAQCGLVSFLESLYFHVSFVMVENLVFQNPSLRKAENR